MSEERYRLAIGILMGIFTVAFIVLGVCFVQNGRYMQYNYQERPWGVWDDSGAHQQS